MMLAMQEMNRISRRSFLQLGTVGAIGAIGVAGAGRLAANPLGYPIGCQTWPVRETIGKDLDGTLKELAGWGFERIELCSPAGYEKMGFGPLVRMKPAELRAKIQAAGLGCESCHFGFGELKDHLDERLAFAQELGLKQMILATFWLPKEATMADWMKAVDQANKFGERTQKAGIQFGFHNHDFEFQKIDGELIYDKLMSEFDPKFVKMQFQVNVVRLGYQAADFFEKYPGRFISIHLQDYSPAEKKDVALGQGVVDWKRLWTAARKSGARNYFVEVDRADLKASAQFLKGLS
jgi:sugar phosphate isomerase/epimerase